MYINTAGCLKVQQLYVYMFGILSLHMVVFEGIKQCINIVRWY